MADIIYNIPPYPYDDPRAPLDRTILRVLREVASMWLNLVPNTGSYLTVYNWTSPTMCEVVCFTQSGDTLRFRFVDSGGTRVAGEIVDFTSIAQWFSFDRDHLFVSPVGAPATFQSLGINNYTVESATASGRWARITGVAGFNDTVDKNLLQIQYYNSSVIGSGGDSHYLTAQLYLSVRLHADGLYHFEAGHMSPIYKTHVPAYYAADIITEAVDPNVRIYNNNDEIADFTAIQAQLEGINEKLGTSDPDSAGAALAALAAPETGLLGIVPGLSPAAAGSLPAVAAVISAAIAALTAVFQAGGAIADYFDAQWTGREVSKDTEALQSSIEWLGGLITAHRTALDNRLAELRDGVAANGDTLAGGLADIIPLFTEFSARFRVDGIGYPPRSYSIGEVLWGLKYAVESIDIPEPMPGGGGITQAQVDSLVDALTSIATEIAGIESGTGGGTPADLAPVVAAINSLVDAVSGPLTPERLASIESLGDRWFLVDPASGDEWNVADMIRSLINTGMMIYR